MTTQCACEAPNNWLILSQIACSSGLIAELYFFRTIYETNLGTVHYSLKMADIKGSVSKHV